MEKIIFATNNQHKLTEVKKMLAGKFQVIGLEEAGISEDIPENEPTLEGNAEAKARYVFNKLHVNVFADDTGLEIDALNSAPGVYSARYAGLDKDAVKNMHLVLKNMLGESNRNAQFRTSICLILNGKTRLFNGIVTGKILDVPIGESGFGYDPIFQPDGYTSTFAEMAMELKNTISHRGKAIEQLMQFLNKK